MVRRRRGIRDGSVKAQPGEEGSCSADSLRGAKARDGEVRDPRPRFGHGERRTSDCMACQTTSIDRLAQRVLCIKIEMLSLCTSSHERCDSPPPPALRCMRVLGPSFQRCELLLRGLRQAHDGGLGHSVRAYIHEGVAVILVRKGGGASPHRVHYNVQLNSEVLGLQLAANGPCAQS